MSESFQHIHIIPSLTLYYMGIDMQDLKTKDCTYVFYYEISISQTFFIPRSIDYNVQSTFRQM